MHTFAGYVVAQSHFLIVKNKNFWGFVDVSALSKVVFFAARSLGSQSHGGCGHDKFTE
jgi:hypothetical protein